MTFLLSWVYEDSLTEKFIVEADTEKQAINCILNTYRIARTPKFVVVETPKLIAKDSDIDLVGDFNSSATDETSVITFKNKLADTVEIDGVLYNIGSVFDYVKKIGLL